LADMGDRKPFAFFTDHNKAGKGVDRNEKRTGLYLFFTLFFERFWDLFYLNFIFIIFSLPVFTVFASFTAMIRMGCLMALDKPYFLFHDFFDSFKKNFWRSTAYGFLCTASILLFSYVGNFYKEFFKDNNVMQLIRMSLTVFVFLVLYMTTLYFFPMQALVDLPFGLTIKNSFLLAGINFKNTALLTFVLLVFAVIFYLLYPYSAFFLIICFGFIAFVISFGCSGGIDKYIFHAGENTDTEESDAGEASLEALDAENPDSEETDAVE